MMRHYILLIFVLTAGCTAQEETLDIGILAILTGMGTTWGESSVHGAQLAIEEINAVGGINGKQLRLIIEDTKADPATAVTEYRKLRDIDGVQFIIGPTWTPAGLALAPIAKHEQVLMISPSLGVAEFNEESTNLFNLWPHDHVLSGAMADKVYDDGHRYVGVFSQQQQWVEIQTQAFTDQFEKRGGRVLIQEAEQHDTNQQQALKFINENVNAVMFTNVHSGHVMAKRLQELGYGKPLYSITLPSEIIEASGGTMNGIVFLNSHTPSEEFMEKYMNRFPGKALDVGADTTYDAIYLLKQAMEATGSEDPLIVAEYFNSLETYNGESGDLLFDGKGGVTKEFKEFVVVDNVPVEV